MTISQSSKYVFCTLLILCAAVVIVDAQSAAQGVTALNQANTDVRSFFNPAANVMYALGGITGLIGGLRVYNKWNAGKPDVWEGASSFFGSALFLAIVATVIKLFFGIA